VVRLDEVIEEIAPTTDQQLLKSRYQNALMRLLSSVSRESDELRCVEPRTGDSWGVPSLHRRTSSPWTYMMRHYNEHVRLQLNDF
jgi:hypothetical protein